MLGATTDAATGINSVTSSSCSLSGCGSTTVDSERLVLFGGEDNDGCRFNCCGDCKEVCDSMG